MATLEVILDPEKQRKGELGPLDAELVFAIIDLFYFLCLIKAKGKNGKDHYLHDYGILLQQVKYSSPLDVVAYLKNISLETAKGVLDRVLFYSEEKEKKSLENESLSLDNAKKKLELIRAAHDLRNNLVADGVDPEIATEQLGRLLAQQRSNFFLSGLKKG
jgi:hypothetical protein